MALLPVASAGSPGRARLPERVVFPKPDPIDVGVDAHLLVVLVWQVRH